MKAHTTQRGPASRRYALGGALWFVACCLSSVFWLLTPAIPAQDDVVRMVESKRTELKEKEEGLKREEQRLLALRKELDEKIGAYTRLLARNEETLKKLERARNEKVENVVKAYEIMPAEDAAARITALDSETALQIMTRMKSKKAGAIIAVMDPQKAASLTKRMTAGQTAGKVK